MTNKKFRQRPNHVKYKFDESKFVQACQGTLLQANG